MTYTPYYGAPDESGSITGTGWKDGKLGQTPETGVAMDHMEAGIVANSVQAVLGWAYAQSYQLVSGSRDSNGALTSGTITWPDGTSGVFTADTISTSFPGSIDAYHVTYLGTPTKTYTQPLVTRDANGAVTAQPAIVVS